MNKFFEWIILDFFWMNEIFEWIICVFFWMNKFFEWIILLYDWMNYWMNNKNCIIHKKNEWSVKKSSWHQNLNKMCYSGLAIKDCEFGGYLWLAVGRWNFRTFWQNQDFFRTIFHISLLHILLLILNSFFQFEWINSLNE